MGFRPTEIIDAALVFHRDITTSPSGMERFITMINDNIVVVAIYCILLQQHSAPNRTGIRKHLTRINVIYIKYYH